MNHFRLSTGLFAFAVASGSALALDAQPRIIGGCTASAGDHKFAVALAGTAADQTEFDAQFCGGSLIHESWVLTAAHCLFKSDSSGVSQQVAAGDVQILFDAHTLSQTESPNGVAVADIVIHANYDKDDAASPYDIALLKLAEPQGDRTTVRLATVKPGEGLEALVVGWGNTSADPEVQAYSTTLREVNIDTWSNAECSDALETPLLDSQLCAGVKAGGRDSCQGDSGGPVLLNTPNGVTQVGVVSFGAGCAQANSPGVNTSVDAFLEWIEDNTADTSTNQPGFEKPDNIGEAFSNLPSSRVCPVSSQGGGSLSFWTLLLMALPFGLRRSISPFKTCRAARSLR